MLTNGKIIQCLVAVALIQVPINGYLNWSYFSLFPFYSNFEKMQAVNCCVICCTNQLHS